MGENRACEDHGHETLSSRLFCGHSPPCLACTGHSFYLIAPNAPVRFELFGNPVFLFGADLANAAIAVILFTAIVLWVRYSKGGVAIRATAEDQQTAYSMGISVPAVFGRAWVLAAATGA